MHLFFIKLTQELQKQQFQALIRGSRKFSYCNAHLTHVFDARVIGPLTGKGETFTALKKVNRRIRFDIILRYCWDYVVYLISRIN
jgi:hypothetical protein